mmetsp:Transcript_6896/g.12658  ORF Transcript_6896/g.12658 Transcript_6896/m.12658 type:complete len:299 (-) Transcript_6896:737-1633(-)
MDRHGVQRRPLRRQSHHRRLLRLRSAGRGRRPLRVGHGLGRRGSLRRQDRPQARRQEPALRLRPLRDSRDSGRGDSAGRRGHRQRDPQPGPPPASPAGLNRRARDDGPGGHRLHRGVHSRQRVAVPGHCVRGQGGEVAGAHRQRLAPPHRRVLVDRGAGRDLRRGDGVSEHRPARGDTRERHDHEVRRGHRLGGRAQPRRRTGQRERHRQGRRHRPGPDRGRAHHGAGKYPLQAPGALRPGGPARGGGLLPQRHRSAGGGPEGQVRNQARFAGSCRSHGPDHHQIHQCGCRTRVCSHT